MTVGSLFSGIGGIDLGFQWAGFETRWFCEIDPFCQRVLAKHWPEVPCYGDIKAIDFASIERVDVLAGGFPCQPVSVAGLRRGRDDARWLWPEFARAIRALRPRYVVVENVPGLLTAGFGDVLGDLAALGYDATWDRLSAAGVGADHLRERVFVVAHAEGFGMEGMRTQRKQEPRPLARPLLPVRHSDGQWQVEPDVRRAPDGFPGRVDRLRALGNAVVPQCAEVIARAILSVEVAA